MNKCEENCAMKKAADITIGCQVIAKYNDLEYSGQVLCYDDTEFEIKAMKSVYKGEKCWLCQNKYKNLC